MTYRFTTERVGTETFYTCDAAALFDRIRDLRAAGMGFREALDAARVEQNWKYVYDPVLNIWRWMIEHTETT